MSIGNYISFGQKCLIVGKFKKKIYNILSIKQIISDKQIN